jgi:hypothetical protein
VDLTISHSFHGKLQITHLSGPLKLKSNIMPSLGFAVKYDYYLHKNIYCIIGFAFENIPTQFHWDFGTYKNYFPEKFKDYGFEKNQKNSHFFLNRSFPVGVGTTLIIKKKQHVFLELILNNVINGDRRLGSENVYTNINTHTHKPNDTLTHTYHNNINIPHMYNHNNTYDITYINNNTNTHTHILNDTHPLTYCHNINKYNTNNHNN